MLDYLGTSERLNECMAHYRIEWEDHEARRKKMAEKARLDAGHMTD